MQIILISGYSGSGKSVALNTLEDEGYYCIDNLPIPLLAQLIEQLKQRISNEQYIGLAIGIDARSDVQELADLPGFLQQLRAKGVIVKVVFLRCEEQILLRRFSETRRKHPLSRNRLSLLQAINEEKLRLGGLADMADLILDTTSLSLHDLRRDLAMRVAGQSSMYSLLFQSFGFKHGAPSDSDFVFDVRCLPNPYWSKELRGFTGRETPVQKYLESQQFVIFESVARVQQVGI